MTDRHTCYRHHDGNVWVRTDLKGLHRDHCLCYECQRFHPKNRERNCRIANVLYALNVAWNMVTPVWECSEFIRYPNLIGDMSTKRENLDTSEKHVDDSDISQTEMEFPMRSGVNYGCLVGGVIAIALSVLVWFGLAQGIVSLIEYCARALGG